MGSDYRIRLAFPQIDERARQDVLSVLDSGRLVAGPRVAAFEAALCDLTGRHHAVATSSGTAALVCAMRAMGVGAGDVVVVPAFTFPAPAMAAAFLGAEVRLCDVDPRTFNLNEKTLDASLDQDVKLVVAIDQFGNPCPAPALEARCKKDGIPLLVDAACSIGATLDGRPCGSFGDAAIFSFHPRKIVTTGEGGVVLTDDGEMAKALRQVRNIGLESGSFASIGINLRPSEVGAAIGNVQLAKLDALLATRSELAASYRGLPLAFQHSLPGAVPNHQTLAVEISMEEAGKLRSGLIEFLGENGVEANIASYGLSRVESLARSFSWDDTQVPVSARLDETAVALPLHEGMTRGDVAEVCSLVQQWLDG